MVVKKQIFKIVIVSPSDVETEVKIIYDVVTEINEYFKDTDIGFQIYNWLKDVNPALHPNGPQGLIDDSLKIKDSDILIGVFYLRFGTPTFNCESGTEYEINQAIEYFNIKNKPEIKIYFKNPKKINLGKFSEEEYKQYSLVKDYKDRLSKIGIIDDFDNERHFKKIITKHIVDFAIKRLKSSNIENPIQESQEIKTIEDEESFLNSLNSNFSIRLKSKSYNLSKVKPFRSNNIEFTEEFDGYQIIIKDIDNLIISSDLKEKSEILIEPRYSFVLIFKNCKNIFLSKIIFGHTPQPGYCTGGVLKFENCSDICINDSILFGSGTEGIVLEKVNSFYCKYTNIQDCTYGIMSITRSKNVNFKACEIKNNCLLPISAIGIEDFSQVIFNNCNFYGNYVEERSKTLKTYLFGNDASTDLIVKNSKIYNNKVDYLAYNKKYIDFTNVEIKDNDFFEGLYAK